jgi:hypothetical protein
MTLMPTILSGIGLTSLVALGIIYARARRAGERASARRILCFLAAQAWLLLSLRVAMLGGDKSTSSSIIVILAPVSGGVLAATLMDRPSWGDAWSRARYKAVVLILANVALLVTVWLADPTPAFAVIVVGPAIAWVWRVWRGSERLLTVASGVLFVWLVVDSVWHVLGTASRETPLWLRPAFLSLFLVIPGMVMVTIVRLVHGCLAGDGPLVARMTALRLALAALLLLALGYRIGFARVWDSATDGVGAASLALLTSMVAIATAMGMELKLPKKRRWVARICAVLVAGAMWSAFGIGGRISPVVLTEERAETIDRAVQRFHERNDRYPTRLADLTPWVLWRVPEPVSIPGQAWCYEGSDAHYRLGYVYLDPYHNMPASVRVLAAAGEPSGPAWACDEEAAKYPGPPGYRGY